MTKYRVPIWRECIDTQTRVVEVEADNPSHAGGMAAKIAEDDEHFWDDVRQEPAESGGPCVDWDGIVEEP
jgi:hypothetical protein